MKKELVLDIDDTLAETSLSCIRQVKNKFGHNMTAEELVAKYYQPGLVPEWKENIKLKEITRVLMGNEFLLSLPAVAGAIETIHNLASTFKVRCYLTSRPKDLHAITEKWLDEKGLPKAKIIMRDPLVTEPSWKINYLTKNNLDENVFIDNDLDILSVDISKYRGEIIFLNRYGAPNPNPDKIESLKNWQEISEYLAL